MSRVAKAKSASTVKSFAATLERMRSRLNWVIVRLPFDAAKVWGLRGQIRVRGDINGFGFRTSLFPNGEGGHFLLVNKRMQKGALAAAGSVVRIRMERDDTEREVSVPSELKRIFAEDRQLSRWHDKLNPSTRNDIAKWVTDPKSGAARVRRAEQIAERMLSVMEAEQELPPVLRVAFARNPGAKQGWDAMSAARRRGHLFGIFYYRNPEGQAKRIGKMMEDANTVADKLEGRNK